jgi:hypothetical protein
MSAQLHSELFNGGNRLKILVSVKFTFKIYIKNNIGKIRSFLEKNVYLKTSEPTCNYHLIIFTKFQYFQSISAIKQFRMQLFVSIDTLLSCGQHLHKRTISLRRAV